MHSTKKALAATLLAALSVPAFAESDHTFATKVTLISEYEYRGISQTSEKPALQLNLDYSHKSGFYAGAFLTNIKWIKDTKDVVAAAVAPAGVNGGKGSVELDLFAGYKYEVVKDVTLDVGYLRYEYPGAKAITVNGLGTALKKPNTDELYIGVTYDFIGVKYSHQVSDAFGLPDSKGSNFAELNLSKEVAKGLTLLGHVGKAKFKGGEGANNNLSYTVWRVGGTYDLNGWLLGAYVKGTDADSALYTYKGKDWSKERLVVSIAKSF